MHAKFLRERDHIIAPSQAIYCHLPEGPRIAPHSSLCHLQLLSLQTVPLASVSNLGVTPEYRNHGVGSVWTWTAIDADSKLICSWMVGNRDASAAYDFMKDLASRMANRIQLTTDGLRVYFEAVETAFGDNIDYAMLVKLYGADQSPEETRYSPAVCIGSRTQRIAGNPDPKHVSTSYVERQNLTMRMHMRRFTRLTNAFSKKLENHVAAVSLHFMYYNFVRIHQTLRVTPAMAAGVTDRVWEISVVIGLLQENQAERRATRSERMLSNKGPALGF